MVNSKIKLRKENNFDFPCLMESIDSGIIVLISERSNITGPSAGNVFLVGTVVQGHSIGSQSKYWESAKLIPFRGEITLSS